MDAANSFWKNFNEGDLKSTIKTKLQSFRNEKNCFKNEDIKFDIAIDEDDFQKVRHTLENPKECKSRAQYKIDRMIVILRQEGHLVIASFIPIHHHHHHHNRHHK